MKMRRFSMWAIVALALIAVLAACGGGGGGNTNGGAAGGRTINVDATEFAFNPNAFTGQVGEAITFRITNKGTVDHNFVILSLDGSQELAKVTTAVGASNSLTFTPPAAGEYPIDCNIAGHKEAGMVGKLTVK